MRNIKTKGSGVPKIDKTGHIVITFQAQKPGLLSTCLRFMLFYIPPEVSVGLADAISKDFYISTLKFPFPIFTNNAAIWEAVYFTSMYIFSLLTQVVKWEVLRCRFDICDLVDDLHFCDLVPAELVFYIFVVYRVGCAFEGECSLYASLWYLGVRAFLCFLLVWGIGVASSVQTVGVIETQQSRRE